MSMDMDDIRASIGNAAAWDDRRELRDAFDALVTETRDHERARTELSAALAERNGVIDALLIENATLREMGKRADEMVDVVVGRRTTETCKVCRYQSNDQQPNNHASWCVVGVYLAARAQGGSS